MIFVPCREGISINPREYCSIEDCSNETQILLGAMLRYDRLRAERGTSRALAKVPVGQLNNISKLRAILSPDHVETVGM